MLEFAASEMATTALADHRAVRAWNRLRQQRVEPTAIESLKQTRKSAIYRLRGVGPGGTAVIAKSTVAETALTEHAIYRQILPELSLPSLCCYGLVQDPGSDRHWLFLEDAGAETYSPELPQHRAAAATWLARLHTASAQNQSARRLPERGPGFYLEQLLRARVNLGASLTHPALKQGEREVLQGLIDQCDMLESNWRQLESLCEGLPSTCVHGDLKPKNIRVRRSDGAVWLLAFDWEIAGWGVPAVDLLKCPDLELYWRKARDTWPHLALQQLQDLALAGAIFRTLISIFWKSLALSYEWIEWPVAKLQLYLERLRTQTGPLGLT